MSTEDRNIRSVVSEDPTLSAEANRLLTRELRQVIGSDEVAVPASRPHHETDRHGTHSPLTANVIETRLALIVTALVLLVVAALVAVYTRNILVLVGAVGLLMVTAAAMALLTSRFTDETDHVTPETAARLEAEGVGDPDRFFNELLEEYRPSPSGSSGRPRTRPA